MLRFFKLFILGIFCASVIAFPDMLKTEEKKDVRPKGTKGQTMVLVPAGNFMMGCNRKNDSHCDSDEKPYHTVFMNSYYIDVTEVTNAQYQECSDEKVCRKIREYSGFDKENQPRVGVSWMDADTYCKWAGKTLTTEAQWEKAARGTTGRVYPWGNSKCGCTCAVQEEKQLYGCGKDAAWEVGKLEKGVSPYGCYDMAGNVWEWVADWYSTSYYKNSEKKNPTGPETGETKVRRGGGYANVRNYLRTSDRTSASPTSSSNSTGFRCSLQAPELDKKPETEDEK